ncbi:pantetheine-phosphate adenylyltransferase [Pseudochelatococcus lubricantis]|uniref:Phosphopantetheine adenylyltransferase n=1 Tax=Pseudochelatococcus lubricantis TaxID=1538102 RepID=A0ABX0V405_9HYPH|nr:pantetheine-phosphate adenylyltransferase [Pseudochelatococcus lubricantis]NIJ59888.1 pantetheine-phosphate adenylyltransferase [Pseudochelatococcus lubricantis]
MAGVAIYAGSFDPVTNGHIDVMRGAVLVADKVVIAIGIHPGKTPLFTAQERAVMLHEECAPIAAAAGVAFEVTTFDDLVVSAARRLGASLLIRGVRDGTDLDYEMQMAGMNDAMAPDIQTVFLPASSRTRHITATLVRQIARMGGDVSQFVPGRVAQRLRERIAAG